MSRYLLPRQIDHDSVSATSHVAGWLSAMELRKKGLTESSALKARHYLVNGLAVYGNRDVFPDDFPQLPYRRGPIERIRLARRYAPSGRRKSPAARPLFIDKKVLLERLLQFSHGVKWCRPWKPGEGTAWAPTGSLFAAGCRYRAGLNSACQ
jgi:hypothetical protein